MTECPDCGGELGTNACLTCLYAFEAGVGPLATGGDAGDD